MLRRLSIENYALIRSSLITFEPGFTVITGETGAGKSILLGALGLVLGHRAEAQALFDKEKKCVVEAWFDAIPEAVEDILRLNDLDSCQGESLILRREIMPGGKSRSFANDTPCGLPVLKALSEYLMDIHSQHRTLDLMRPSFLLEMIDSYIPKDKRIEDKYTPLYNHYIEVKSAWQQLHQQRVRWMEEQDYWKFLFEELNVLQLKAGEQQEMEDVLEQQSHLEQIRAVMEQGLRMWDEGESGMRVQLDDLYRQLKKIAPYHQGVNQSLSRWESVCIEIKDLESDLDRWAQDLKFSPQKKAAYEQRLDLIYKVETKHRVSTVEELISLQQEWEAKLKEAHGQEEQEKKWEQEKDLLYAQLQVLSSQWTTQRQEAAVQLTQKAEEALSALGMQEARLQMVHEMLADLTPHGQDKVKLLFNANKGGVAAELSKVASGGELSRLMLALKSVVREQKVIGCLILDEIDTGVSGEIAGKVASMMRQMSQYMQVISITHLPQIAAKASAHLRVYKQMEAEQTVSCINRLDQNAHTQTIAAMMSNEHITPEALRAAEALIND